MSKMDRYSNQEYSWGGSFHFPKQIDSLNKVYLLLNYEKDEESILSLWHVYILITCSFLESSIRNCYKIYLRRYYHSGYNINKQHEHLIEKLQQNLNELTWNKLIESHNHFMEEPLPNDIKNSASFKSISILFKLRNLLTHGNDFEVEVWNFNDNNDSEHIVSGKAKCIYDYLEEKDLFSIKKLGATNHFPLNNKAVHFFVDEAINFTKLYFSYAHTKINFDFNEEFKKAGLYDKKHDVLKSQIQIKSN